VRTLQKYRHLAQLLAIRNTTANCTAAAFLLQNGIVCKDPENLFEMMYLMAQRIIYDISEVSMLFFFRKRRMDALHARLAPGISYARLS
jgi:hypothetical protein